MPLYLFPMIFGARVMDVSIGTVRTICMVRGFKTTAVVLGFFEVLLWLVAINFVLRYMNNPLALLAYCSGYAAGIGVGMAIETWLALGSQAVRVIVRDPVMNLAGRLREMGYLVTRMEGTGRDGPVEVDFIVVPRRKVPTLTNAIFEFAPHSMITVEDVVNTDTEELRLLKRPTMLERLIKVK